MSLQQGRRQQAYRGFMEDLRRQADVEILLERPRITQRGLESPGDPVRGPAGAPMTVIMFSDFECPYCRAAQSVLREFASKYEGKVKFVYKQFPLPNHARAQDAAEAALCAHKQDRFWAYHDALFSEGRDLSDAGLKATARLSGLDGPSFDSCLGAHEMAALVAEDIKLGTSFGVQATPTFFLNGRLIRGAAPIEEFENIARQILKETGRP